MWNIRRFSFPILIYFLGLSLLGLCLVPQLAISGEASEEGQRIQVTYTMPGQSCRTVEQTVTVPLEGVLSRVPGIKEVSSTSDESGGNIVLLLDKQADVEAVRFEVSTQIRQTWPMLPQGVSYPQLTLSDMSRGNTFVRLLVYADTPSETMGRWIYGTLCPHLSAIQGVEDVRVSGLREEGLILTYNTERLAQAGLTPQHVLDALQSHSGKEYVGSVHLPQGSVRALYVDKGVEVVGEISMKSPSGRTFRLKELMQVERKSLPVQSCMRINGMDVVQLDIRTQKGSNQLLTGERMRAEIGRVEKLLPNGFHLKLDEDMSQRMGEELWGVALRSLASMVILLLLVYLASRNWRHIGVIFLSIAANICVAFICYRLLGVEIHLYSLVGITISFGMIIDNIIVMANHLMYRGKPDIFLSVLASTLTTVASLTLFFLMDGVMWKGLWDFALIVMVNLVVSLAVSLFLTPALMEVMKVERRQEHNVVRLVCLARLDRAYMAYIGFARRHRKVFLLGLSLLFGWPLFLLPHKVEGKDRVAQYTNLVLSHGVRNWADRWLGGSLYYFLHRKIEQEERHEVKHANIIRVQSVLPEGSSLEETDAVMRRMEQVLAEYPGNYTALVNVQAETGSMNIQFDGERQWGVDIGQLQQLLNQEAVHTGNATWSISGPLQSFSNIQENPKRTFTVCFTGYNYDRLMHMVHTWCKRMTEKYLRIREVVAHSSWLPSTENHEYFYRIHDDERAEARSFFQTLQHQMPVQSSFQLQRKGQERGIPLYLQPDEDKVPNRWLLENQLLMMNGKPRRVSQAATVEWRLTPQDITKRNQSYTMYVSFNYLGDYSHACDLVTEEVKAYDQELPEGYRIYEPDINYGIWGKSEKVPWSTLALVIGVIYLICAVLFNSLTYPLLIILSIPLSYIGVFLGFGFFGLPLEQGGVASIVLLSGLTCNSVIFLLSDYKSLRKRTSFIRAYQKAFHGKVVPILITAVSTVMGFVPFMWDAKIHTFWFSLSIGIIFGLLFSIPMLCLYLPLFLSGSAREKG